MSDHYQTFQPSPASTEPQIDSVPITTLVKCPVCLKIPIPPIFGCSNGHIICENCKERVEHCPVCRADKFNVRNIIIEEILKGENLECEHCGKGKFTGDEYVQHVAQCERRPVECNCKLGKFQCTATMVPMNHYLTHMKLFHGLQESADTGVVAIKFVMNSGFKPQTFKAFNRKFILQSHRQDTQFFTWISSVPAEGTEHGDDDSKINLRLTLYYYKLLQNQHGSNRVTEHALRVSSKIEIPSENSLTALPLHSSTPAQVLKSGQCLLIKNDVGNYEIPPYVWPGFVSIPYENPEWGYEIKLWKAHKLKYSSQFSEVRNETAAAEHVSRSNSNHYSRYHGPQNHQHHPRLNISDEVASNYQLYHENSDEDEDEAVLANSSSGSISPPGKRVRFSGHGHDHDANN